MTAEAGTFSVSGTVTAGGHGLAGVTIAYTVNGGSGQTATDADGAYSLPSLVSGDAVRVIGVTKAGYKVNEVMPAAEITIAGDVTDVDFTMNTDAATFAGTFSGMFTVSGTVTAGAHGLAGVTIAYTVNGGPGSVTITDADGEYSISELRSGDIVAVTDVIKAGYKVNEEMPAADIEIDGTITVRDTSSGLFSGASWDVRDHAGNVIISKQTGDEASWGSDGNNVFKVTLHKKTYAGTERSITKNAVMEGIREYGVNWMFTPVPGSTEFYSVKITIHTSDFIKYKNNGINRTPGYSVNTALVTSYVTTTSTSNNAFENITAQLIQQFPAGMTQKGYTDRIMSFVQELNYKSDAETAGRAEYWAFPIETLFTATGDCEDVSMLTMALVKEFYRQKDGSTMSAALIIFWTAGHAMAAINFTDSSGPVPASHGINGWYPNGGTKFYYACETTGKGWKAGEIPSDLNRVWLDHMIVV